MGRKHAVALNVCNWVEIGMSAVAFFMSAFAPIAARTRQSVIGPQAAFLAGVSKRLLSTQFAT
ncbi:hypothetical protein A8B75_19845 [Sphingomonadales bacterium EhC05]|nr:hypothetical protein A8B75_19845 [Sphingomonadales bacterium EhC05]